MTYGDGNFNKMIIRPEIWKSLILHEELGEKLSQELTLMLRREFQGQLAGGGKR